ncbi:MAG: aminotransferase class I/II-fold pyridoxal phosphate-dependent enzyme [Candidatus Adiutrix sp.]|nr:aminotransferase class I/II-fold pyridoxal phosphate-dependent enzyme [Candidatus Adiutrix sp.]
MKNKIPAHGGKVVEAARALGRDWSEIIDFSANINPLGQPPGLKEALFRDFDLTLHYPEADAASLRDGLAVMANLPPTCIMPGAGSTPQLYLICRALDFRAPAIIGPAFAEYEAALTCGGLKAEYVLTRPDDDWLTTGNTLKRLFEAGPGAVFLANPANPTGRLTPGDLLLELADECDRRGIWLIADEAFIDFTGTGHSLLPLARKNKKLIVLRSLTKIFALPGLRLAFMAAHPETIGALSPLVEPWSISSLAVAAGHFCLARTGFREQSAAAVARLRNTLVQALSELGLGRVFPSESNYVLLKLRPEIDHQALLTSLFNQGLLVRDASNFRGLGPGFLRLAVRPESEVEALIMALRRALRLA